MNKLCFISSCLFLAVFAIFCSGDAAFAAVNLTADSPDTVSISEDFDVTIKASGENSIAGAQIKVNFDQAMLRINNITSGHGFVRGNTDTANTQGHITVAYAGEEMDAGVSPELATISFKAVGEGQTNIGIHNSSSLSDSDMNDITGTLTGTPLTIRNPAKVEILLESPSSASLNEDFDLAIKASGLSDIAGIQAGVSFDRKRLQINSITGTEGMVSGDSNTANALGHVTIAYAGESLDGNTSPEIARISFRGIAEGRTQIALDHSSLVSDADMNDITAYPNTASTAITITSAEKASVTGTLRDSNAQPVTGNSIEIWAVSGDPCSETSILAGSARTHSADGTYKIGNLSPGTYYLRTLYSGADYLNEWWAQPDGVTDCENAQAVTLITGQAMSGADFHLDSQQQSNHAPVSKNGTLVTDEGVTKTGSLSAEDEESDALTYSIATLPAKGIVTLNSETGYYIYTPNSGETGADSFTFKVYDGEAYSDIATVSVTIIPLVTSDNKKAIIVAGGGPYPGNNLWYATQMCANYAYKALLYQEYRREDIYYLSPDTMVDVDNNGILDDVDADATLENLEDAIKNWARDASELLIYMTDHGGPETFRLNTWEMLRAEELDEWLDDLQKGMTGNLIFIYDACYSGSFLSRMNGEKRIIITSSSEDQSALFTENGALSFSYQFWSRIYYGNRLYDAFLQGSRIMEERQTAFLDMNGNGIPNEKTDKSLAGEILIGRGYVAASDIPLIRSVSPEQTLEGETFARLWARDVIDTNGIERVWAVIIPPDFNPDDSSRLPITDLPIVELQDLSNVGLYEGVYEDFTLNGMYDITIYAMDTEGVYSLPGQTRVIQTDGRIPIPTAAFSFSEGANSLEVGFTDTSRSDDGILSWKWDFGDGGSEENQHPTYTYTGFGTYPVKLTVTERDGDKDHIAYVINVNERGVFLGGDMDSDGIVGLRDLIVALKVLAGKDVSGLISGNPASDADVNSDGKIGMEEVVHILGKI